MRLEDTFVVAGKVEHRVGYRIHREQWLLAGHQDRADDLTGGEIRI